MTPPSPITPLPSGYELLSPDFLREHGAVEGMKFRHKDAQPDELWLFNTIADIPEIDIKRLDFIAPTGTTAMLSTPLPEVRCVCEGIYGTASVSQSQHDLNCPAHPRNRLVRVLPQLLAGLPEKPESLLWANIGENDWEPYDIPWPFIIEDEGERGLVAYAIPRHVLDAIEAGNRYKRFEICWGCEHHANFDALSATNKTEAFAIATRSGWTPIHDIKELQPKPAPPQASGPTDGEMPSDAEMFQWINEAPRKRLELLLGMLWDSGKHGVLTLRTAATTAMKDQTK